MAHHITVSATSGTEVEGIRIDDELGEELFGPNATHAERASGTIRLLRQQLVIYKALTEGLSYAEAESQVNEHIEIIS